MGRYVEVPADAIRQRLAAAGFRPSDRVGQVGEEVYDRWHDRDPRYVVRVYSSVSRGAAEVRGVGADAIRVCAIFYRDIRVDPTGCTGVGIYKAKRVHRSGSVEAVLDRMIERAREAYAFINERRLQALQAAKGGAS